MELIVNGNIDPGTEVIQSISGDQARYYRIIPKRIGNLLEFYVDENIDQNQLHEELEIVFGCQVKLFSVDKLIIEDCLNKFYIDKKKNKSNSNTKKLDIESEDFVIDLILEAKDLDSSDIHIEPYEDRCRIRIRIDGQLVERFIVKKSDYPSLVNKIKIMSNLDIAEKRLPQDGRIFYNRLNEKFDIRVSILPTLHGEKVVMRLLGNDATYIDIEKLGFSTFDLNNYLEGIKSPNGILLISGPTGSGKTTTLYATLKLLNKESRNILTIEDPIEYTLEGINQTQLKENIGLTFGKALRTFLRQDPDIIMVGEIRDTDTANMAVRAALTGHLVLSTIHTNSAWGTVSRLIDMNIPPYLIANTLNTSVAQRLLRTLCPHCKRKVPLNQNIYPRSFKPYKSLEYYFEAIGCDKCFNTGYKGRKAVYEVIPIDHDLSECIKNSEFQINEKLKERNIRTLAENAFKLFENGETTIDEIYSILYNN